MWERLRRPGGRIGTASLVSACLLAAIGVAGSVAMLAHLVAGAEWWSDTPSDVVISLLFFLLTLAGAAGFWVMPSHAWGGAALAVVGGLAFAFLMFWAIFPVVIGVGTSGVALLRARALHGHRQPGPTATVA